MKEIIERLTDKVGLSPEQAEKALETIIGFVKEKYPMLEGAIDQVFKSSNAGDSGFGGLGN